MSDSDGRSGPRRQPRYSISNPRSIQATLTREGEDQPVASTLTDLSKNGLRLGVPHAIPKGENVRITLELKGLELRVETQAVVCWAQPSNRAGWFIGCALAESLSDEIIAELAAQSTLDRRRDCRQDVSFQAEARSELNADFVPVQIVNYSSGGFRAITNTELATPSDRLMVRIGHPDNSRIIRTKVQWISRIGQGYAVGCSFLTKDDCLQMQAVVNPRSRERWLRGLKKHRSTKWRAVAAAVAIILTLQLHAIVLERPEAVLRVVDTLEPLFRTIRDGLFSVS